MCPTHVDGVAGLPVLLLREQAEPGMQLVKADPGRLQHIVHIAILWLHVPQLHDLRQSRGSRNCRACFTALAARMCYTSMA